MKTIKLFVLFFVFLLLTLASVLPGEGLFETGQEADIILGPYSDQSNARELYFPSRSISDGKRLYVTDTRNNRVLVWNSIPTDDYQPADIVLGQSDFLSNYSGAGPDRLFWPVGIHTDGERLFVADTQNHRVLIWNTIPTRNGQPANIVLGQPDFYTVAEPPVNASTMNWPWDVHYDGTRLYVVCTGFGRVLVWNSLPTQNNQPADFVIGQKDFFSAGAQIPNTWNMSTPRSIATDGKRVAIGGHDFLRVMLWDSLTTENGQPADIVLAQDDFYTNDMPDQNIIDTGLGGVFMDDKQLFLVGSKHTYIWETWPIQNNQPPDRKIGNDTCRADGWGVSYDQKHLFVTDSDGSRVLVYNQLPQSEETLPDVIIGQPDMTSNISLGRKGFGNAGGVVSSGKKLFVSGNARIIAFQDLPEQDGAEADNILSQYDFGKIEYYEHGPYSPIRDTGQLWTDGVRLFAIDAAKGVLIWNRIPTKDHILYDRVICPDGNCGDTRLAGPKGVTVHGDTLLVCDTYNHRILCWFSIPEENESHQPDLILDTGTYLPFHIDTDGKRIVAGCSEGDPSHRVFIWSSMPEYDNQAPDIILDGNPLHFNFVLGVQIFESKLFIVDGFGRVCIYNTFPTSANQPYDVVLGQDDFMSALSGLTRSKMYSPLSISFDGEYLWVGEFKFSDRVLGFHANIDPHPPAAPNSLQASNVDNFQFKLSWQDNASNERGYRIVYRSVEETAYQDWGYLTANTRHYLIDGLNGDTDYVFKVISYNSYGESISPDSVIVHTKNSSNVPPFDPFAPFPPDGETNWEITGDELFQIKLSWQGGDPDPGDEVTYDVYFNTVPELYPIAQSLSNTYLLDLNHGLPGECEFFWKIIAKDKSGLTSESPLWTFTTPGAGLEDYALLNIEMSENGTTVPAPKNYCYDNRTPSIIWAISDSCFQFSHWEGDVSLNQIYRNPATLKLKTFSENTIKAQFVAAIEPEKPHIIGPDNLISIPADSICFRWKRTPFALSYILEISTDSLFSTISYCDTIRTDTTTMVKQIADGGQYFWRLYAFNNIGKSVYSNVGCFYTCLYSPSSLTAKINQMNHITISWLDSSRNETGYIIERQNNSLKGTGFAVIDSVEANSTTFTDSLTTDSTSYTYRICAVNDFMMSAYSNTVTIETHNNSSVSTTLELPLTNNLSQNFPNPFNPQTTITFSLKESHLVDLRIYNIQGRQVKQLINKPMKPGLHIVNWNGRDQQGKPVAGGIYLYRLEAGAFIKIKRMILLR